MNVKFDVFIDKILSGEKRQTIRKDGKKWENVKMGDKLTLYDLDTIKLGEAEVESIDNIDIELTLGIFTRIRINDKYLFIREMRELALNDGFSTIDAFFKFFHDHYGEEFKGKIIKWKNFKKADNE